MYITKKKPCVIIPSFVTIISIINVYTLVPTVNKRYSCVNNVQDNDFFTLRVETEDGPNSLTEDI